MRNSFTKPSKNKTLLYAVLIVIIAGIIAIALQDINLATKHTTQNIELKLEN